MGIHYLLKTTGYQFSWHRGRQSERAVYKSLTIKVAPKKTQNAIFLFIISLLNTMGVRGRYGSPKKTMKKRNYIWDSIDNTSIKGDKPLSKNNRKFKLKSDKKKKSKKERRSERQYKRIPRKYAVYIKSKYWRQRRNRYFQEWGKKCFICGSVRYIVLHHLEYKHEFYGNEPDTMLVQLCHEHHEEFHALYGVKKKMYNEFDDFIDIKMSEQVIIR